MRVDLDDDGTSAVATVGECTETLSLEDLTRVLTELATAVQLITAAQREDEIRQKVLQRTRPRPELTNLTRKEAGHYYTVLPDGRRVTATRSLDGWYGSIDGEVVNPDEPTVSKQKLLLLLSRVTT